MKFEHLIYVAFTAFLCVESPLKIEISGKKSDKVNTRDSLKQPFGSTSIWNMPIGANAVYVPADLEKAMAAGMTIDEDIIVLTPKITQTEIYTNNAGWNRDKDRCIKEVPILFSVPIPNDFTVSSENWNVYAIVGVPRVPLATPLAGL